MGPSNASLEDTVIVENEVEYRGQELFTLCSAVKRFRHLLEEKTHSAADRP